ncbi:hypothetical protein [Pseudonocardia sp. N23]|uniref:hypothetical protein n=1 Tax=Pseudonocardia sp. N23 TaxID=1987376 RepID=UPI000BFCAD93|nr:hypothetical protein [Pseudonocardia sp. N23]GAY10337.1 hypothetical protein TOK_4697 [Pseudonocardia sp. N23]
MSNAPDGGPANRGTPARSRQLVDLAEDVRKVRGDVGRLRTTVGDLAGTVAEFAPQLLDVQRDLLTVRGVVEELATAKAAADNPPVDWFAMSAAEAETEWIKLGDWVHSVLGGWYQVTRAQLPDRWALHRPAFLQVAWLSTSHAEAYLPLSHPNQAAEWNTRWLDAALAKVEQHILPKQCRAVPGGPGQHLVDELDAAQQEARGPAAGGTSPYPNPYPQQQYAESAAARAARSYAQPQHVEPAHTRAARSAGQETIRPDYWGPYFSEAMRADLAWRRERDDALAQRAAAAAAATTDPDADADDEGEAG